MKNTLRILCNVGLLVIFVLSSNLFAAGKKQSSYYPYVDRWFDVYIGVSASTDVDMTLDDPNWGGLYNPMEWLDHYGFSYFLGIRPLAKVPFIKDIRIEAERMYKESKYDLIYNPETASWANPNDLPKNSRLALKDGTMANFYYDIRWFSKTAYPYIGFGVGAADFKMISVDQTELPNGLGEEYSGEDWVPVTQFMVGFEYDTKIIKAAFFVEYRFVLSGAMTAHPTNDGYFPEDEDENSTDNMPPDYQAPSDKEFKYNVQELMFGFKYYLF